MHPIPPLPRRIAGLAVPQDAVSAATWRWVHGALPAYLLAHSVRSFCWGATLAAGKGWPFDDQLLWTASLLHDVGLTRISQNRECFEVAGAEVARRFVQRRGMPPERADRVARAIVLHMRPTVTLDDGVEAVLLGRATGLDVLGGGFELVNATRAGVMSDFPRGAFDRLFLTAISREAALRPTCQSARLLHQTGLTERMARSPWVAQ